MMVFLQYFSLTRLTFGHLTWTRHCPNPPLVTLRFHPSYNSRLKTSRLRRPRFTTLSNTSPPWFLSYPSPVELTYSFLGPLSRLRTCSLSARLTCSTMLSRIGCAVITRTHHPPACRATALASLRHRKHRDPTLETLSVRRRRHLRTDKPAPAGQAPMVHTRARFAPKSRRRARSSRPWPRFISLVTSSTVHSS